MKQFEVQKYMQPMLKAGEKGTSLCRDCFLNSHCLKKGRKLASI